MAEDTLKKDEIKTGINELRNKLNELNEKKEEWFKKKEDLKAQIAETISKIKSAKGQNDVLSKDISEFKAKRDEFNNQVRELIAKIKELNNKKDEMLAKAKFQGNPVELKSRIDRLEQSLETQAYSFDKEKKIMKEINTLRKQYDSVKGVDSVVKEINEVSRQITEAKKKGDEFHNKLRENTGANKDSYESFMHLSKDIGKLKKTQEEAFNNFIKFKQEYAEISRQLKEKFGEMKGAEAAEGVERKNKQREKKDEMSRQLHEKAKGVEEKLKNKKVLTTEDIITLQGEYEDTENF